MYYLAALTGLSCLLSAGRINLPFRFGSVDAWKPVRPAVFYIVEDVVAVDGNGGIEFRQAWNDRYESSEVFRQMIWTLSVVWMLAFVIMASVFTGLVWRLPIQAVYAVGWAAPFPCVGVMVVGTVYYVKGCLRREREVDEVERRREVGSSGPHGDERTPLLGA